MGLPLAPILIGAGVGALGGAVTGRNPFETALLGAALGTGAGALGAGGAGATAGTAASAGTTGAVSLVPTTIAPTLATTEGALAASSPLMGYTASGVSPFLGAAEASMIPTASSVGAGFGTQELANMSVANPTLFEQLKPYATIDNLKGASMIANQFQPKPMSPAPQGRVSQGQAPQGGLGASGVEGLLAEIEKQRQTQRQPISLLVG